MTVEVNKIHFGDCLEVLQRLPDDSIDCIITSPPYNKQNSACYGYLKKKTSYVNNIDFLPKEKYQKQ